MNGVIIYNHSLKTESYMENIQIFRQQSNLEAVGNDYVKMILTANKKPEFDYCIFLDKDIQLAYYLEKNGVKVYNSAKSIAICDNKAYTHLFLEGTVPMPKTYIPPMSYKNPDFYSPFPYPFIVKECYGSWGEQVYMVHDDKEFENLIHKLGKKPYIIQEYCKAEGTDYRLYTIGGKVVAAIERKNKKDFRANCELGGIAEKISPTKEMIEIAETSSKKLGLDFGGIDIIKCDNGYKFIEANSSAMVKNLYNQTGVEIPKLLSEHIKQDLV